MNRRFILSLPVFVGLVACTKAGPSHKVQSYDQFSLVQNIPITQTCNEKCVSLRKEFRYVVHVGQKIYCYWDEKRKDTGFDFDQIAANIESRISSKTSIQDYYMLLMEWAASFHDGHVNVMVGSDIAANFEFYDPNVRFELLAAGSANEKLIVSKVGDEVSSLKSGTEVITIDGKPWKESLQEAARFASGSTERMRRNKSAKRLLPLILGAKEGFKDLQIEGVLNGQPVQENISRVLTLSDGTIESDPATTGIESIKASIIGGNIGYLKIDSFVGSKLATLLKQAMNRLIHTDGLLIDVRLNGGGNLDGDSILAYLIDQQIVRYSVKVRNSDMLMVMVPHFATEFDFTTGDWSEIWKYKVEATSQGKYKSPVVILTSPNCFSACDTFVSALKEHGLAKVVGESTGGGTGSPKVFDLPVSKLQFRYSVQKGYKAVSGDLIEGAGTSVDLEISPTTQERAAGKDDQLKKAVVYLRSLISGQSAVKSKSYPGEPDSVFQTTDDRQPMRAPLLEMDSEIKQSNLENQPTL